MTVNLYVHTDPSSPTIQCWENFFCNYLPGWTLRLKIAEDILQENPTHILFPGGSGSAFAKRLGEKKREEIVEWVDNGGSYIGVCAGAYLAVSHLKISPLTIPDRAWERGLHQVALLAGGKVIKSNYHNGPIFESHPEVEVWATFKSDHIAEGGFYRMIDTPAITYNRFGKGQVSLFSPHLEKSSKEVKMDLAQTFEYIDSKRFTTNEQLHKTF